jgi:AcrR family transcriptional regulator
MGRKPKFAREDILAAALELVAAGGPGSVTIAGLAGAIGAPTGSIYHRFESREQVLAELWMQVVETFQSGFVTSLEAATSAKDAARIAVELVAWTRAHPSEARILAVHRRQDFVASSWPSGLVTRARALEPALGAALESFAKRVFGRVDTETRLRVRFALVDAPLAAVKPFIVAGKPAPRALDSLIADVTRAALERRTPASRAPARHA